MLTAQVAESWVETHPLCSVLRWMPALWIALGSSSRAGEDLSIPSIAKCWKFFLPPCRTSPTAHPHSLLQINSLGICSSIVLKSSLYSPPDKKNTHTKTDVHRAESYWKWMISVVNGKSPFSIRKKFPLVWRRTVLCGNIWTNLLFFVVVFLFNSIKNTTNQQTHVSY